MTATIDIYGRAGVIAVALVDDADRDLLARFHWNRTVSGYAIAYTNGDRTRSYMHRFLMGLARGDRRQVDHRNGNTLDNRRSNLRVCTHAENQQNQGARGGSSRYRGVSWHRQTGKWRASARVPGGQKHLGLFGDEMEAAVVAARFRFEQLTHTIEDTELLRLAPTTLKGGTS